MLTKTASRIGLILLVLGLANTVRLHLIFDGCAYRAGIRNKLDNTCNHTARSCRSPAVRVQGSSLLR